MLFSCRQLKRCGLKKGVVGAPGGRHPSPGVPKPGITGVQVLDAPDYGMTSTGNHRLHSQACLSVLFTVQAAVEQNLQYAECTESFNIGRDASEKLKALTSRQE